MQEVNAAWQVLRSPADRAAYDDALRARSVSSSPMSTVDPLVPSFADQLVVPVRDESVPAAGRRPAGFARWAPLLIVGLLLVGGLIVAISVSSRRSSPIDQPELRTNRYEIGSCVVVTPGPQVVGVSCDLPNSGRVAATTDYPRPCPAGTQTVSIVVERLSVCLLVQ